MDERGQPGAGCLRAAPELAAFQWSPTVVAGAHSLRGDFDRADSFSDLQWTTGHSKDVASYVRSIRISVVYIARSPLVDITFAGASRFLTLSAVLTRRQQRSSRLRAPYLSSIRA